MKCSQLLALAQSQVIQNCARYYKRQPGAGPVVLVIAAGVYWQWAKVDSAKIKRLWNETGNIVNSKYAHFSVLYVLGRPESDEALDSIRRNHIHEELRKEGHQPSIPPELRDEGDNEDVDESSSDPEEFAGSEWEMGAEQ